MLNPQKKRRLAVCCLGLLAMCVLTGDEDKEDSKGDLSHLSEKVLTSPSSNGTLWRYARSDFRRARNRNINAPRIRYAQTVDRNKWIVTTPVEPADAQVVVEYPVPPTALETPRQAAAWERAKSEIGIAKRAEIPREPGQAAWIGRIDEGPEGSNLGRLCPPAKKPKPVARGIQSLGGPEDRPTPV